MLDSANNLEAVLVPLAPSLASLANRTTGIPLVHLGYQNTALTALVGIIPGVKAALASYPNITRVLVTGHSQGKLPSLTSNKKSIIYLRSRRIIVDCCCPRAVPCLPRHAHPAAVLRQPQDGQRCVRRDGLYCCKHSLTRFALILANSRASSATRQAERHFPQRPDPPRDLPRPDLV